MQPRQSNSDGHESVRPSFPDDVLVGVRLRPHALAMLRKGLNVAFVRLDVVPDPGTDAPGGVYDLYIENFEEIDAVPAWDAPHSARFVDTREVE